MVWGEEREEHEEDEEEEDDIEMTEEEGIAIGK